MRWPEAAWFALVARTVAIEPTKFTPLWIWTCGIILPRLVVDVEDGAKE
jgi:hypothetical protein